MELRHLLYFKTVAEELHFRKAAGKLFISQPPLSRQIRELEAEMGVRLFERNNKRVQLTAAGSYFKRQVDEIFARLEESKTMARSLHDAPASELRIGYISSTYHPKLLESLQEVRQQYPLLRIKLFEMPSLRQVEAIKTGELDAGIMRAPVQAAGLQVRSLFQDPFVMVLPQDMVLADTGAAGLGVQPFVFFSRDYAPLYHAKLLEICHRMGFEPDISHEVNNVYSILRLVAQGLGVSILPAAVQTQHPELPLRFIPVNLPVYTEVVLVCRQPRANAAVGLFLDDYADRFGSASSRTT
ncbi:LysR family transcriptional regulator [Pedobacter yulinensis]|uniref:LysR family transcriptional regulator n=1 Tax=Pedobacter yulinensis TaxID=2126353 RepID=A0A2T3HGL8_9SPHI|nr:LysR substrate-binding domain-containing protein [Pedobacter yulinensis]PST81590.1 LysR family transcriptional regulator [Pedobacter yulinensis]